MGRGARINAYTSTSHDEVRALVQGSGEMSVQTTPSWILDANQQAVAELTPLLSSLRGLDFMVPNTDYITSMNTDAIKTASRVARRVAAHAKLVSDRNLYVQLTRVSNELFGAAYHGDALRANAICGKATEKLADILKNVSSS
jgi:hypothetical protein